MLRWRPLCVKPSELRIDVTLACGQSFRWKVTGENEWSNVLEGRLISLKQTDSDVLYTTHLVENTTDLSRPPAAAGESSATSRKIASGKKAAARKAAPSPSSAVAAASTLQGPDSTLSSASSDAVFESLMEGTRAFLHDYLWLDVKLEQLYADWSALDARFTEVSACMPGVRMLRQDPVENLFSFICSSNNNISRITQMIDRLCQTYGTKAGEVNGIGLYTFPSPEDLAKDGVESTLRELGFGYRAKFIEQSAKQIVQLGGAQWLRGLRDKPYKEAHQQLTQLQGIGAKVADCICLMSLDKHAAIPVDVHVRRIAERDYSLKVAGGAASSRKSSTSSTTKTALSSKAYVEISSFFQKLWGEYAGWAHSVLFSADLKRFEGRLAGKSEAADEQTEAGDAPASEAQVQELAPPPADDIKRAKRSRKSMRESDVLSSTSATTHTTFAAPVEAMKGKRESKRGRRESSANAEQ